MNDLSAVALRATYPAVALRATAEGGGKINGAFLKHKLIDEFSILICPAVDGVAGSNSIVDYNRPEGDRPGAGQSLRLTHCETLARINLTLATYTQWYWKIDLHNLMNFLSLRADSHAQHEIRVYGEAVLGLLERWVPLTYEAFIEHRLGAVSLSRSAISVIQKLLSGQKINQRESGLSKREWADLTKMFKLQE